MITKTAASLFGETAVLVICYLLFFLFTITAAASKTAIAPRPAAEPVWGLAVPAVLIFAELSALLLSALLDELSGAELLSGALSSG